MQRDGQTMMAKKIFWEAAEFGLRDGLYIPMRQTDMSYSAVVLSGSCPELGDPAIRITVEVLGTHFGLAAKRLCSTPNQSKAHLTRRQRECLLWVRAGKSSNVIGEILGISPATVNEHVGGACRELQVSTRVQAVVEATRLGLLDL